MGYAGDRAHVSGHICHCPFERMYDTCSDHWLWVVVFFALYLMVPLFKQHFHFAWHGLTTESVYSRGTKSQSHGQHVYEMSHIFIRLNGCGGEEIVLWVPTLHLVVQGQEVKVVALGDTPSPSQKGDLLVIHIRIPISHRISPRCWWWVFGGVLSSLRVTSQQRSSMSCHNLSSTKSSRFACNWHGVLPPRWQSWGKCWWFPSLSGLGWWAPEGQHLNISKSSCNFTWINVTTI